MRIPVQERCNATGDRANAFSLLVHLAISRSPVTLTAAELRKLTPLEWAEEIALSIEGAKDVPMELFVEAVNNTKMMASSSRLREVESAKKKEKRTVLGWLNEVLGSDPKEVKQIVQDLATHPLDGDSEATVEQKFAWRLLALRGFIFAVARHTDPEFLKACKAEMARCKKPSDRFRAEGDWGLELMARSFERPFPLNLAVLPPPSETETESALGRPWTMPLAIDTPLTNAIAKYRTKGLTGEAADDALANMQVMCLLDGPPAAYPFMLYRTEMVKTAEFLAASTLDDDQCKAMLWLSDWFTTEMENLISSRESESLYNALVYQLRENTADVVIRHNLGLLRTRHPIPEVDAILKETYDQLRISKNRIQETDLMLSDQRLRKCPGADILSKSERNFLFGTGQAKKGDLTHQYFHKHIESIITGEKGTVEGSGLAETLALRFRTVMHRLNKFLYCRDFKLYTQSMILLALKSTSKTAERLSILQIAHDWLDSNKRRIDDRIWGHDIFPAFLRYIPESILKLEQWKDIQAWWSPNAPQTPHWSSNFCHQTDILKITPAFFAWLDSGSWSNGTFQSTKAEIVKMIEEDFSDLLPLIGRARTLSPHQVAQELIRVCGQHIRRGTNWVKRMTFLRRATEAVLTDYRRHLLQKVPGKLVTAETQDFIDAVAYDPTRSYYMLSGVDYSFFCTLTPHAEKEAYWLELLRVPPCYLAWMRKLFSAKRRDCERELHEGYISAALSQVVLRSNPSNMLDLTLLFSEDIVPYSRAQALRAELQEMKRTEILKWAMENREIWKQRERSWKATNESGGKGVTLPLGDMKKMMARLDHDRTLASLCIGDSHTAALHPALKYVDETHRVFIQMLRAMRAKCDDQPANPPCSDVGAEFDLYSTAKLIAEVYTELQKPERIATLPAAYRVYLYFVFLQMAIRAQRNDLLLWLDEWRICRLFDRPWMGNPLDLNFVPATFPSEITVRYWYDSHDKTRSMEERSSCSALLDEVVATVIRERQDSVSPTQEEENPIEIFGGKKSKWLTAAEFQKRDVEGITKQIALDMKVKSSEHSAASHCAVALLLSSRTASPENGADQLKASPFHWMTESLVASMAPSDRKATFSLLEQLAERSGTNKTTETSWEVVAWLIGLQSASNDASHLRKYLDDTAAALGVEKESKNERDGSTVMEYLASNTRAGRIALRTLTRLQTASVVNPAADGIGSSAAAVSGVHLPAKVRSAMRQLEMPKEVMSALAAERHAHNPTLLREAPRATILFEFLRSGAQGHNAAIRSSKWFEHLMQSLREGRNKLDDLRSENYAHAKWIWQALFFDAEDLLAQGIQGTDLTQMCKRYMAAFEFALSDRGCLNPRARTHTCRAVEEYLQEELRDIQKTQKVSTFNPYMLLGVSDLRADGYGKKSLFTSQERRVLNELEAKTDSYSSYVTHLAEFMTKHFVASNDYQSGNEKDERLVAYTLANFLSNLDFYLSETDYKFYTQQVLINALRLASDVKQRLEFIQQSSEWLLSNFKERDRPWLHNLSKHLGLGEADEIRATYMSTPRPVSTTSEEDDILEESVGTHAKEEEEQVHRPKSKPRRKKRSCDRLPTYAKQAAKGLPRPVIEPIPEVFDQNDLNSDILDYLYADEAHVFLETLLRNLEKANAHREGGGEDLAAKKLSLVSLCDTYRQQGVLRQCFRDWLVEQSDFTAWQAVLSPEEESALTRTLKRHQQWKDVTLARVLTVLQSDSQDAGEKLSRLDRLSHVFNRQLTITGRPLYPLDALEELQENLWNLFSEFWPRSAGLLDFLHTSFNYFHTCSEDEQHRTLLALEATCGHAIVSLPPYIHPASYPAKVDDTQVKLVRDWFTITGDPAPWLRFHLRNNHLLLGLAAPNFTRLDG